jgi:uracil-DNA glycosylase
MDDAPCGPASGDLLDCIACPRLATFLAEARGPHADWHNRPVPAWGDPEPRILVVGLAPGFRGANRTGKPFCGDQSGVWLYRVLHELGLASSPDPLSAGGTLLAARITNAVKCVPPANQPTPEETRTCRSLWLKPELCTTSARVVLTLGAVAFDSVLVAAGLRPKDFPFRHGASLSLHLAGRPRWLVASWHPSPQNTRTGRLSYDAFRGVFEEADKLAAGP